MRTASRHLRVIEPPTGDVAAWRAELARRAGCARRNRGADTPVRPRPPGLAGQHQPALERDAIITALADNDENPTKAAQAIGMSRATIYRKIRQYGIR